MFRICSLPWVGKQKKFGWPPSGTRMYCSSLTASHFLWGASCFLFKYFYDLFFFYDSVIWLLGVIRLTLQRWLINANPDETLSWNVHVQTAASASSCVASVSTADYKRRGGKEKPSSRIYRSRRWYLSQAAGICQKESVLSPRLQPGAIDLLLSRDVNSIANRRARERTRESGREKTWASSGSSEKVLIIWLSSQLLMGGYFWEPRINWAPERPAYYLPIEKLFPAQRNWMQ